jgi:hypothetical protein
MLNFAQVPAQDIVHFSRDIDDLVINTTKAEESISIRIYVDTVEKAAFSLSSSRHSCSVRMRYLLEGVLPDDGHLHAVALSAEVDSSSGDDGSDGDDDGESTASLAFSTIRGGAHGVRTSRSSDFILSLRPQTWKSYPSFPNPRIAILSGSSLDCPDPLKLIVYPVGMPASEYDLSYYRQGNQHLDFLFLRPQVAYDFPYGLRAYDFVLGQKTLRTIMMKDDARVRMFYFRNTFGQLEEIYATGASKRDAGGAEYKTHTSRDVEYETGNDFKEKFITDTGDIGSQALVDYWTGFFQSSEHYIWQDGQRVRIIIDEVSSGESTAGQIASFTFSWHLAEQPTGRIVNYGPLEPYQYEVPEL